MVELKDSDHLLSQHTKITTICRTITDEKDQNQAEKIFHH